MPRGSPFDAYDVIRYIWFLLGSFDPMTPWQFWALQTVMDPACFPFLFVIIWLYYFLFSFSFLVLLNFWKGSLCGIVVNFVFSRSFVACSECRLNVAHAWLGKRLKTVKKIVHVTITVLSYIVSPFHLVFLDPILFFLSQFPLVVYVPLQWNRAGILPMAVQC